MKRYIEDAVRRDLDSEAHRRLIQAQTWNRKAPPQCSRSWFHTIPSPEILENLVANHLLKRAHYLSDTEAEDCELYYIRDKEKREVDFLASLEV